MSASYFNELFAIIAAAESLGIRTLANGTRLIGHVPHVAPEAWLHTVFPPLDDEDLRIAETVLQRSIPNEYVVFLKRTNGLKLFSNALALFGWRKSFERVGDISIQPFSITAPNLYERPSDSADSYFFIGAYKSDGSLLYLDERDGTVHQSSRVSAIPFHSWKALGDMLVSEARRLSELYDEYGRGKDF